jgi:hypothetical protein
VEGDRSDADHDLRESVPPSPAVREAAAYCGDAHGLNWRIDGPTPAELVKLSVGGRPAWYRLARHPRTGAPALDWLSRLLYVPAPAFRRRRLAPRRTTRPDSAAPPAFSP